MTQSPSQQEEIQQQAGKILSQVAGYVGVKTMEIGLRSGLIAEIAKHPQGISADDLAKQQGFDPLYTSVWCRSAYAAEVLDLSENQTYTLAPHMETLLLNQDFPGNVGGLPTVFTQPEMFDVLAQNLTSGERIWWDKTSPSWIQGVSATGQAFYNRLIPGGLSQVLGLADQLASGARRAAWACGRGVGCRNSALDDPRRLVSGVWVDSPAIEIARERLSNAGVLDRTTLIQSPLEDFDVNEDYDVVINNISMHECRDIEKVTANIYKALKPDGYFVISDFPFPESTEDCRTVPARIMCGIQFFEATIDDQLLPVKAYL